jgi:FlaA1/EpsC-like NDP-sugar epimerase
MSNFSKEPGRDEIDWTEFLGRPRLALDPELAKSAFAGKSLMITGAGGSIGSGLARAVAAAQPRTLVLLDLSEGGLNECYRHIIGAPRAEEGLVVPMVGSVVDGQSLRSVLREYKVESILHAAAYKHVPLMESNPLSAILNNAIGTYRLVGAACEAGVSRVTMVSTDKAVNPRSIMGASKRIGELVLLSHSSRECAMNVIRLGNVLGSSGSVVPIFQEQCKHGLPLTVTHPGATRYFLTSAEAEAAILQAAGSSSEGKIFIADCGGARRVADLARYITRTSICAGRLEPKIEYIGLRPGEKLSEELVAFYEEKAVKHIDGMRAVDGPRLSKLEVAAGMKKLEEVVEKRDLRELMAVVTRLVPNYAPSELLRQQDTLAEAR